MPTDWGIFGWGTDCPQIGAFLGIQAGVKFFSYRGVYFFEAFIKDIPG